MYEKRAQIMRPEVTSEHFIRIFPLHIVLQPNTNNAAY